MQYTYLQINKRKKQLSIYRPSVNWFWRKCHKNRMSRINTACFNNGRVCCGSHMQKEEECWELNQVWWDSHVKHTAAANIQPLMTLVLFSFIDCSPVESLNDHLRIIFPKHRRSASLPADGGKTLPSFHSIFHLMMLWTWTHVQLL